MRILSLEAENFKRLRAVSITPAGSVVEVTGENGEGKTSTLDAIWAALGGKDACPAKPINSGAEDAVRAGDQKSEIRLLLGEAGEPKLKVTRKFKLREGVAYTTDLIVENAEGARFGKPQDILNTLLGDYCFDPLAFTRLKDAEQVTALRAFVPEVDFANIEGLNKRDFDERTDVGRRLRDLKGQLAAMPVITGDVPERVDVAALEAQLGQAATHNSEVATRRANREAAQERAKNHANRAKGFREQAAALIAQAEQEEGLAESLNAQIQKAEALPEPIDTDEVQRQLAEARQTNALVDKAEARRAMEAKIKGVEDEEAALTAAITKRKDEMAAAVKAAKMPVAGLGFGDDVITLNGEPFSQASTAEKIRASVAIAAAMNPKLRVARIADGSLLDRKSWAALAEYAEANDLQVWVETVEAKGAAAVLIHDGGVAAAEPSIPAVEEVGDVV